jgi:hypothetical protein
LICAPDPRILDCTELGAKPLHLTLQPIDIALSPLQVAEDPKVQVRVHGIQRFRSRNLISPQCSVEEIRPGFRNEAQNVLPVPVLDRAIGPEIPSQAGEAGVSVCCKAPQPETWPFFVDMACTSLAGDRRREHDHRRKGRQPFY